MKERRGILLRTAGQMNGGAILCGVGFLLYLAASALGRDALADGIVMVFGVIALYVFASVAAGRKRNKEAVSYSLLWGQGALTLLLAGCAVLTLKLRLGL